MHMNTNKCICCGIPISEDRQICNMCEKGFIQNNDKADEAPVNQRQQALDLFGEMRSFTKEESEEYWKVIDKMFKPTSEKLII